MPVLASDGLSMSASMPHHSLRLDPGELHVANSRGLVTRELLGSAHANSGISTAESDSGVCPESRYGAQVLSVTRALPSVVSRRSWLAGLGAACLLPKVAHAGAITPMSLRELVETSHHVVVATPRVGDSMWEQVGDTRRIVTYTRLTIDETLDARPPADSELMVRTLGGQVGPLGQVVHGEAELRQDEVSVLFLKARADGTFRVTALAQGHYPLSRDTDGLNRLTVSPRLSEVFGKEEGSAIAQLRDQSLDIARSLIGGVRRGK